MKPGTMVAVLVMCGAQVATAQVPARLSAQGEFGLAFRDQSAFVAGSTDGFQGAVRVGWPVSSFIHLVGEVAVIGYADAVYNLPSCSQPGPCASSTISLPGLGVGGAAIGVQPLLGRGLIQLRLTLTGGGYWLYHRNRALPAQALGLRGGLGLGLQLNPRIRVVMEGGSLYLQGRARAANSRHVGFGVVVN